MSISSTKTHYLKFPLVIGERLNVGLLGWSLFFLFFSKSWPKNYYCSFETSFRTIILYLMAYLSFKLVFTWCFLASFYIATFVLMLVALRLVGWSLLGQEVSYILGSLERSGQTTSFSISSLNLNLHISKEYPLL